MSQQFTIEAVGGVREWHSPKFNKSYKSYALDLKDAEGHMHMGVESNRQVKDDGSHNQPQEGEEVWASIETDRVTGNDKLKLDYDAMKEIGASGGARTPVTSTSGSQDYPRTKGRADAQPAIQRQVALKIVAPKINAEGMSENVKSLVRAIEDFINEASGDPHGADLTSQKLETELGATPVPAASNSDDSIPF